MSPPGAIADRILVDWGTSALRAWAVGRHGEVLARRSSPDGMATLDGPPAFERALLDRIGDLLPHRADTPVPVVVCGMAGARNGWAEAGYRQVPCEPVAAGGLTRVATRDARLAVSIIPGLSQSHPPDVMRGEETQLAGLLSGLGVPDAVVCLPGTHSKWVRIEAGRAVAFTTFMTGELFAAIATNTILRHSVGGDETDDDAPFADAVRRMLAAPQDLTSALFSIRAAALLEGLTPGEARARLSGLLVGAELAATCGHWQANAVHLVGADRLAGRYAEALDAAGGSAIRHDAEALTLAGLSLAHQRMQEGS